MYNQMNHSKHNHHHFDMNNQQHYHRHHQEYTFIPIQPSCFHQQPSYESSPPTINNHNNNNYKTSNNTDNCQITYNTNNNNNNNSPNVQASFHTIHNTYMSNNTRPMVIHTKINTNNNNNSSLSPSKHNKATLNNNTNTNNGIDHPATEKNNCSSSSDDSASNPTLNHLGREKYKRPCPSESYRNIAASLTLEEISKHYHLTRQDACTALKVSWRDLKERLNKLGVSRWPKTNAKKVTQFNTVTSHFEQLCSVIETSSPTLSTNCVKKKVKTITTPPTQSSLVIVDNSTNNNGCHTIAKQRTSKPNYNTTNNLVKIHGSGNFGEKNPCCLSPNNGSTCSLSSPSTASNISFNMQQPTMGSPKNKNQKAFQQAFSAPVCTATHKAPCLANTYQYSQTKCEVQYHNQSDCGVNIQKESHYGNCRQSTPRQSLPALSTFLDESNTRSVHYPTQTSQLLPSISSFDTFLQSSPPNNGLKRGRAETSDDVLFNKVRIV